MDTHTSLALSNLLIAFVLLMLSEDNALTWLLITLFSLAPLSYSIKYGFAPAFYYLTQSEDFIARCLRSGAVWMILIVASLLIYWLWPYPKSALSVSQAATGEEDHNQRAADAAPISSSSASPAGRSQTSRQVTALEPSSPPLSSITSPPGLEHASETVRSAAIHASEQSTLSLPEPTGHTTPGAWPLEPEPAPVVISVPQMKEVSPLVPFLPPKPLLIPSDTPPSSPASTPSTPTTPLTTGPEPTSPLTPPTPREDYDWKPVNYPPGFTPLRCWHDLPDRPGFRAPAYPPPKPAPVLWPAYADSDGDDEHWDEMSDRFTWLIDDGDVQSTTGQQYDAQYEELIKRLLPLDISKEDEEAVEIVEHDSDTKSLDVAEIEQPMATAAISERDDSLVGNETPDKSISRLDDDESGGAETTEEVHFVDEVVEGPPLSVEQPPTIDEPEKVALPLNNDTGLVDDGESTDLVVIKEPESSLPVVGPPVLLPAAPSPIEEDVEDIVVDEPQSTDSVGEEHADDTEMEGAAGAVEVSSPVLSPPHLSEVRDEDEDMVDDGDASSVVSSEKSDEAMSDDFVDTAAPAPYKSGFSQQPSYGYSYDSTMRDAYRVRQRCDRCGTVLDDVVSDSSQLDSEPKLCAPCYLEAFTRSSTSQQPSPFSAPKAAASPYSSTTFTSSYSTTSPYYGQSSSPAYHASGGYSTPYTPLTGPNYGASSSPAYYISTGPGGPYRPSSGTSTEQAVLAAVEIDPVLQEAINEAAAQLISKNTGNAVPDVSTEPEDATIDPELLKTHPKVSISDQASTPTTTMGSPAINEAPAKTPESARPKARDVSIFMPKQKRTRKPVDQSKSVSFGQKRSDSPQPAAGDTPVDTTKAAPASIPTPTVSGKRSREAGDDEASSEETAVNRESLNRPMKPMKATKRSPDAKDAASSGNVDKTVKDAGKRPHEDDDDSNSLPAVGSGETARKKANAAADGSASYDLTFNRNDPLAPPWLLDPLVDINVRWTYIRQRVHWWHKDCEDWANLDTEAFVRGFGDRAAGAVHDWEPMQKHTQAILKFFSGSPQDNGEKGHYERPPFPPAAQGKLEYVYGVLQKWASVCRSRNECLVDIARMAEELKTRAVVYVNSLNV